MKDNGWFLPEVNEHLYSNGGWDVGHQNLFLYLKYMSRGLRNEPGSVRSVLAPPGVRSQDKLYRRLGSITVLRQRLLSVPAQDQVENVHWT